MAEPEDVAADPGLRQAENSDGDRTGPHPDRPRGVLSRLDAQPAAEGHGERQRGDPGRPGQGEIEAGTETPRDAMNGMGRALKFFASLGILRAFDLSSQISACDDLMPIA